MSVASIKNAVRIRDGFRCMDCGMTHFDHLELYGRTLDVHRTTPGSPYTVEGCVSLCQPCHYKKPKSPRGEGKNPFKPIPLTLAAWHALKEMGDEQDRAVSYMAKKAVEAFLSQAGRLPKKPGKPSPE